MSIYPDRHESPLESFVIDGFTFDFFDEHMVIWHPSGRGMLIPRDVIEQLGQVVDIETDN